LWERFSNRDISETAFSSACIITSNGFSGLTNRDVTMKAMKAMKKTIKNL
jgi:molybdopterin biosynthesis enzyme MoaB